MKNLRVELYVPESEQKKIITFLKGFNGSEVDFFENYTIGVSNMGEVDQGGKLIKLLEINVISKETEALKRTLLYK